MSRISPVPEARRRAPLGAALDDNGKAPPVRLRAGNVVPFDAARSGGSARPTPAQTPARPDSGPAAPLTAAREARPGERMEWLRWPACLAIALACHAAAAAALLVYWPAQEEQMAGAPLILVELAPLPVAPAATPTDVAPGPQQMQTAAAPPPQAKPREIEPEPVPPADKPVEQAVNSTLPEAPQVEQPVTALPPPKPIAQPQRHERPQSRAHLASAPSTAEHRARHAAAPAPAAASGNPDALPNWKSRLIARLERYKRYPAEAQARGEHGVAQLAFSIDRAGRVHHARIQRSSGSRALDRATLALVERAQPLPPPPPAIRGAQIAIVVPIRYSIR